MSQFFSNKSLAKSMIMFILLLEGIFKVIGHIVIVEVVIFPKSLIDTTM